MIKNTSFVILPLFIALFVSCEKAEDDSEAGAVPLNWGKLAVIKHQRTTFVGTDSAVINSEVAEAEFYTDPTTISLYADAGNVNLNGINIPKGTNNKYRKEVLSTDNPSTLGFADSVSWQVDGGAVIPGFKFKDPNQFPDYNQLFPDVITRSAGLTLVFNETTVTDADSVRVLIDDTYGNIILKTFAANADTVTIPASTLSVLQTINDKTAFLGIFPYKGINKVYQGKGFFFIREERTYRSVNIN
jgi:hypothetical protein